MNDVNELTRKDKYDAYIESPQWSLRRQAYFEVHPKQCRGCKSQDKIHLHHNTYDRMGAELDTDLVPLCIQCHELVHCYHSLGGKTLSVCTFEVLAHLNGTPTMRPKRVAKRIQIAWQMMNQSMENTDVNNLLLSAEQKALTEAISWSNANLSFIEGAEDRQVAADILRGLTYMGWKLAKV